ncbi:ExeM/NucH family extracellular endonuclease [Vibrio fluvialis]|uniref:ExeM/NucH family extracellular endonuclease n=1 Tax=Vibrio fluvialis TaxID=676 RepID=UPI00192C456C|nr:ExeM/NucH family extracellular endonuclease [Vibrio fluvialis]MBL4261563.1 ExeM/NucH family extracellular endonuclease [Vibrio fluvialis]
MHTQPTFSVSFSALALAIAAGLSAPARAEIVLSQYVEGSSYNKAIEIANTGDASVSLDGYSLAMSTNGSGSWDKTLPLSGRVIAAHDVLVLSNSGANSDIQAVTDISNNSVINFNGNDPVALLNSDGSVHDVIGDMGGADFGKDRTLVRQADALTPSAVYQPQQWMVWDANVIDGLGSLDTALPEAFTCNQDGNELTFTSIQDIQGEGDTSPFINGYPYITDDEYTVKGVVSAVTGGLTKGFYLQALDDDNNPLTSEGLFVFTGQSSSHLQPGDVVCTRGKVQEYYNLTQLKVENNQWEKLSEQAAPAAHEVTILGSDEHFAQTMERYEGMLVTLPKALDMRVTRTFGYDYDARRNNMVLAQGRVNMQPNQLFPAGSEQAQQQSLDNAQRRLFVESDAKAGDGQIPYYPQFGRSDIDQDGSTEDYIRVDDTLFDVEGVVTYSYGEYRLVVTNTISQDNLVHNDPRTAKPKMYEGDLRIASFNVLNYFNSPYGGDANQHGDNRGASNFTEFSMQQAKIVNAILRLDVDIVGLMEIENNGFGDGAAIRQLVDQLNERIDDKKKRYQFVAVDSNQDGQTDEKDSVGSDAITTGVIYRDKVVKLLQSRVIPMPSQQAPEVLNEEGKVIEDGKNYQRDTLAPTFKVKGGNETITVAVNHLKSKGSACWEDAAPVSEGGQGGADADLQGSCENFRVAGAVALGEALAKIDGHKVILGDMNSYGKEDPMLVLTDYTPEKYGKVIKAARNTVIGEQPQFGDDGAVITQGFGYLSAMELAHKDNSWSYSYNDEVGALDHLLVSDSLKLRVVDAIDWHINGGESTLFDYNDEYKGDLPKYADHFRASDHDPAVVELNIYGGSFSVAGLGLLLGLGWWRRKSA